MKTITLNQGLIALVAITGAYMVVKYAGLNPPTLSGLVFIVLAIILWRK